MIRINSFRLVCIIALLSLFASGINAQSTLPSDIPGLQLWLRSDSGVVLNNLDVSSWNDLSGQGNHATQPLNTNQPLFIDSVHGFPAIRFDGINDGLQTNFFSATDSLFIMIIYSSRSSQSVPRRAIQGTNNWLVGPYDNNYDVYANGFAGGPAVVPFNFVYQSINITPLLLKHYVNGLNVGNITSPSYPQQVGLGSSGAISSQTLDGDVLEVIAYKELLSDSLMNLLHEYINDRYAPPIQLPDCIAVSPDVNDTLLSPIGKAMKFLWSTGDTSRTIRVDSSGNYWVRATSIFGTTSFDTVAVNFFPDYNLPSNPFICPGGSKTWNTLYPKDVYTFQWQDNSTDSLLTYNTAGQYYLKITDSLGCYIFTDTLNVIIDNYNLIASLGPDTSLCSGNSIYLKTGSSQTTSYFWSDSSTNDSLQINASGQYWVTATNINGCSKIDTINVSVAGSAPAALFSSGNSCFGDSIQFNDQSSAPVGDSISSWNWSFGDSFSSISQNPYHMFADTGSYTVRLEVMTNVGCSASLSKNIHVYPNPVANFISSNLCQNANVQFTGNATTFGYPISQWNWNFNDPSSGTNDSSVLQNPNHIFFLNGNYSVRLIVSNIHGCSDTIIKSVIIKPAPLADFTSALSCKSDLTQFNDNSSLPSGVSISSSFWNFGDLVTSTVLNPVHTYSSNVSYSVIHVITATNGCKDTVIKTVNVYPKPFAYFSHGNSCVGAPVDFMDLSVVSGATITGWQWTFGTTGTSLNQHPQQIFSTSGNVNTQLIVTSSHGCKDTAMQTVSIHANPVAAFTFTPQYGPPPLTAFFTNISSGASSYSWNFDDGSSISTLVNPSHVFNDTGTFQVSLAAVSAFGCTDTVIHSINTALRVTDVAVAGFTTTLQNNFLTITLQLDNNGTVDISAMELYAKVNDGALIKDEWRGRLVKQGTMFYTFNSNIYVADEDHYICVSVLKPNGIDDDRPDDNELCQTLTIAGFQVFAPFPNPTENIITLPVFMPVGNDLSIVVFNDQGKKIEDVYSGYIEEGFHNIQLNTQNLNSGMYVFRIMYKDEIFIIKVIKNN